MFGVALLLALAQTPRPALPPLPSSVCGLPIQAPAALPPGTAGPVMLSLVVCFPKQGGVSLIDPQTYLAYITTRPSRPSAGEWVKYDDAAETALLADFRRVWATGFLDDLTIDVQSYALPNGVEAKVVVFEVLERQRVKIVGYEGNHAVSTSDIETALKDKGVQLRLDSFMDPAVLKRVASIVRETYANKGFMYAEVKPRVVPTDTPKTVNVTFDVVEGPRVGIRHVLFLGNRRIHDDELVSALKANRPQGLASLLKRGGTYNPAKDGEDAEEVVKYYRDRGFVTAAVGQFALRALEDSPDHRTRWVQVRIPVTEGPRFRIGEVKLTGNTVVRESALRSAFNGKPGEVYSQAQVEQWLDKIREIYGAAGYFEFTAYPDLDPRPPAPGARDGIVDVTLRMDEGKRYFVHRVTFVGNTHTRDNVIRRELAIVEAGVFNTEALKYSVRRLNQLGYFKPLEGKSISVEKTPDTDDKVDVTLKLEEQNRNQITFGAGVSQYEGLFGNVAFATSNFVGRGETLSISAQKGTRVTDLEIGLSEPFIFGRAISAGINLFSRKADYQLYSSTGIDYSEVRSGFTTMAGVPVRRFTRAFLSYGFQNVDVAASGAVLNAISSGSSGTSSGMTSTSLLDTGAYTESSLTPSLVYDTVNDPRTPRSGMRLMASYKYAGGVLGGTTDLLKPEAEATMYVPLTRRIALGLHANGGRIYNYDTRDLPYYARYFLGGENQIRGVNLRTVGPLNANNVSTGGTKFVLFNGEMYYDLYPGVRALLFHDAGQAFSDQQRVDLRQLRTSSGAELRVTLPMIGVPLRLIYAWNVYRDTFQPARAFKFAIGTAF